MITVVYNTSQALNASQKKVLYSHSISCMGSLKQNEIEPEQIDASEQYHTTIIKLSKAQIKQANDMTKPDAAKFYHNIICDRMNIPTELRPELIIEDMYKENPRMSAKYNCIDNNMLYYTEHRFNKCWGNWWTFGLIRHEMEHFRQTIDIMRNKNLFNDYCNYYKGFIQRYDFSNVTKEDLEEEGVKDIEEFKVKLANEILNNFNKFREKVLKYYPEIDDNSDEYKKAKKYLDGIEKYEKFGNPSNIYGTLKYLFLIPNEFYACKTQGLNWINYFVTSLIG